MSVHFKTIVTTALLALAATAVHAQDIKIGYNADVDAMVGPADSGNALAWLHIPQQRKIPVVVPIATGTEITTRYAKEPQNYLFRVSMVVKEIFAVKGYGVTILLVEQMANQALAVAERAYVIETGRITIQGSGAELRRDPRIRAAYLGEH